MLGKINLVRASWSVTGLAGKVTVLGLATVIGIANVIGSAGASLNAVASNATTATAITNGTLNLTLADGNGGTRTAGFTTAVTGMAPGDTIVRYVRYTQGANNVDALNPTLMIADSGSTILTKDVRGLYVLVQTCLNAAVSVAYNNDGTCSAGTETIVLHSTPLASLKSATALNNFVLNGNNTNYLKFSIMLPSGNDETNTNGTTTIATSRTQTITNVVSTGTAVASTITFTASVTDVAEMAVGSSFTVSGISSPTGYNGTYTVLARPTSTTFTAAAVNILGSATSSAVTGTATESSTHIQAITSISATATAIGSTITFTASAADVTELAIGQSFTVTSVVASGYNATYTLLAKPSSTTFTALAVNVLGATTALTGTATETYTTVQNLTANITWTLAEDQRVGTTTQG